MSAAVTSSSFPSTIHSKLKAVRQRHALTLASRSLAIAACVFVLLLLVCMLLDWWFPFMATWARYALKYGAMTGALIALASSGWSPFRRALGWDRVAGAVDHGVPVLQERWSTVSSLARRDQSQQTALEKAMASQVTREAIAMERVVVPSQIAAPKSPHPALLAAAASTLLLSVFFLITPTQFSLLLHRFWNPNSNVTATRIRSLAGSQLVPRGQKISLTGQLKGVTRSTATLVLFDAEGGEERVVLRGDATSPNRFEHSLRLEESMSYRWVAGDGRSPIYDLRVIDFPQAAELEFTVKFPEYIDRLPVQRDRFPRRVKVPENSDLQIAIRPDIPLLTLQLSVKTKPVPDGTTDGNPRDLEQQVHQLLPESDGWYRFGMSLTGDVLLEASMTSADGLGNQRRLVSRIDVISDKAPVARIVGPTDETAVAFEEQLEIQFEAHDDYGIAAAELVIYDEQQKDKNGLARVLARRKIDLGDQRMSKHLTGRAILDLKELGVAIDSEVSYAIRVTDNRGESKSKSDDNANRLPPVQSDTSTSPDDQKHAADATESERDASFTNASKRKQPISTVTSADLAKHDAQEDAAKSGGSQIPTAQKPKGSSVRRDAKARPGPDNDVQDSLPQSPSEKGLPRAAESDAVASEEGKSSPTRPPEDRTARSDPSSQPSKGEGETQTEPDSKDRNSNLVLGSQPKPSVAKNFQLSNADRPGPTNTMPTPTTVASVPRSNSLQIQRKRSGQNTTTRRRRIHVTAKLSAIAAADARPGEDRQIRESVVEIDRMLESIESGLRKLVEHTIADSDRAEQFRRLDTSLQNVESYVAELRSSTRENQFAFVGLQMVDITRTHITPARDRVFQAIQRPAASDVDATQSLGHIVRGRELLAALLKRYDRVVQEKKLQKSMGEAVTMYEVYQQKRRLLMREARQNMNPMQRKMAIVEVDQEYLDRLAEVVRLRGEMMEELASMLGDDPRLLSRYMELIKRRGKSLRDRLTEISERQYEATEETLAWTQIDEAQQQDYWLILAELRLTVATDLAKDAAQLSERIAKQLPLEISADARLVVDLIQVAGQIAKATREISFAAEKTVLDPSSENDAAPIVAEATRIVPLFDQLSATLDQLLFDHSDLAVVQAYVEPRLLEAQAVRDLAGFWQIIGAALVKRDYASLVQSEQHQLAVDTQLLRIEMLEMRAELDQQFQRVSEATLPDAIVAMIHELHHKMETITFNQIAAAIRAGGKDLESCSLQQEMAMERLEQAEALFDKMRRAVVEELDQYDVRDPNIADLRDPTLDEFLARLEREPSIARQLGIPNRRRNLRVLSDSMLWTQNGGGMLGSSGQSAAARARQAMKRKRENPTRKKTQSKEPSEADRKQRDDARKTQQMLEQSLVEIKKRIDQPETSESNRRQLTELAAELERAMGQADPQDSDRAQWDRVVKSDEAKRLLAAIANGEPMADTQWNKLLSTLDDGLWQVKGKQPPEAYRKAIQQYQDQLRELTGVFDE